MREDDLDDKVSRRQMKRMREDDLEEEKMRMRIRDDQKGNERRWSRR